MEQQLSRRSLLTGASAAALGFPLAGCFGSGAAVDPNVVVNTVAQVLTELQRGVLAVCTTVIPTATTLLNIAVAIAGSFAAIPPVVTQAFAGLVQQVAKTLCDAVAQKLASGVRPRLTGRRASGQDGPFAGAPVISYGPVVINGRPVEIECIAS